MQPLRGREEFSDWGGGVGGWDRRCGLDEGGDELDVCWMWVGRGGDDEARDLCWRCAE